MNRKNSCISGKTMTDPSYLQWLSEIRKGDLVIYCWRGGAGHLYPKKAVVLRRGKTFFEIQVDSYSFPFKVYANGASRWHDVSYYAFIAPISNLQEEFERSNDRRRKFNLTAKKYGQQEMEILDFHAFLVA